MSDHKWFQHPKFKPLVTCQHCGIVKRADGENKPCPGSVRVELRALAPREGGGEAKPVDPDYALEDQNERKRLAANERGE
jgi:hypothetical protein